jgi:predicted dehydrogenase
MERLLQKLAVASERQGDEEHRTGVYMKVHEDSSTVSTQYFTDAVEFPKKSSVFGVGIIGCGLIGQKRAKALGTGGRLVACADKDLTRAQALAGSSAKAYEDYKALLALPEVDIVVIATLHDSLAEITYAAIEAGKHVLVEKPAARCAAELEKIRHILYSQQLDFRQGANERAAGVYEVVNEDGERVCNKAENSSAKSIQEVPVQVRVGFNHRYHRAIRKAKSLVDEGALGDLMFIRARYGHGGRIGYDKEWRSDLQLSGGGELIDQGPHVIDLSRWFLGDFTEIAGSAHTYYWDMPVDDNAFLLLKTKTAKTAFLHVSCTEWKNLFSMEIYGKQGKLHISGLGGSYGTESLTWYHMLPEMGPPETTMWEYPMADDSWAQEIAAFYEDIRLSRPAQPGIEDAYAALQVIDRIYGK